TREVERVARLGLPGVVIATAVNGRNLDAPEFASFFQCASEQKLLVFIHPTGPILGNDRLNTSELKYLVGFPFETAVAAVSLMLSGLLDECANLRICLAHAGGALPSVIGRLERGYTVLPRFREALQRPPGSYMRSLYYDTVAHNSSTLALLLDTVGAD